MAMVSAHDSFRHDVCPRSNSWSYLREHIRQCVNTSVENSPIIYRRNFPEYDTFGKVRSNRRVPPPPLSFYFPARMKDVRHDVNFTRQRYDSLDIYSGNLTELWCIVSYTVCLPIKISRSMKIYNSEESSLKIDVCRYVMRVPSKPESSYAAFCH